MPGNQQSLYWLCRINRSLSSLRKNFNHLCHLTIKQCRKYKTVFYIFLKMNLTFLELTVPMITCHSHLATRCLCVSIDGLGPWGPFQNSSWARNWNNPENLFALILILTISSSPNFAHVMTAQLSCHVQNCVLMWSLFYPHLQHSF